MQLKWRGELCEPWSAGALCEGRQAVPRLRDQRVEDNAFHLGSNPKSSSRLDEPILPIGVRTHLIKRE